MQHRDVMLENKKPSHSQVKGGFSGLDRIQKFEFLTYLFLYHQFRNLATILTVYYNHVGST